MESLPLLMTEDFWRESPLSIAAYYGAIIANQTHYIIVDEHGRDVFELSAIAEREGRDKAIAPGEPCDLIDRRLQGAYKRLGRKRILALIEKGKTLTEINRTKA